MSPTLEGTSTATVTPSRAPTDISISTQASNLSTGLSDLAVELSATPNQAKVGDQVTFTLKIVNHGQTPFTGLHFSNFLPEGFNTVQNDVNGFAFDEKTRELSWTAEKETAILAGESLILEYTVSVDLPVQVSQIVDTASLMANELNEPVLVEASLTFSGLDDFLTLLDSKGGEALGLDGQIKVSLPKDSLVSSAVVSIQDLKPASAPATDGEPWIVFELELRAPQLQDAQPLSPGIATGAGENDRAIPLEPIEAKFDEAVELSVSFDRLTNLATLGADQAPFLVTLDEASATWVRMPLKSIDRQANQVTAELTHFSTWGVGFGPSFPTNGAGVLLFDSAHPTLFTGRSKYSIPIWTPPGRNGMQPNLGLSYSSGSVDGVLGDVQAPWVGMGWSIDTAEIARKITTTSAGYGYENKFMLLLNGTGHELILDATTAGRYHTKEESFLYIQLHNDSLGNNTPAATNLTGEWWEVVEKDGTRWRLGWTLGSEQLAAMVAYPGSNPPTGTWATLGYAGNEPNVVAGRWRVDQVTDVYNNQMTFTYQEEYDVVAGTSAYYDRANYVYAIYYTSHTTNSAAAYSVVFIRESRGTNDVPAVQTDWDNWDTERLDRIEVTYGGNVVRTYDLGYQIRSYADGGASWQTTTLTSLATSGSTTLTPVVNTIAPTVTFTYVDKDNRAAYGSWNEWAYPRLATINNGWGGVSTYTYENDGRPYTAWYNWRVQELAVTDYVNTSPMKSTFTYNTPCYDDTTAGLCNADNLGSLIGYGQTTTTNLAFDGVTILAKTVHKFLTAQEWQGREYETLDQTSTGTTLHKTYTLYNAVETSGYPAGAYFAYATTVDEFVYTTSLVQVSHMLYSYDSDTGNLTSEWQFFGASNSYRKTEYQYVTNPSPAVWILNTLAQRTVKDASGVTLSEQQYGYNGNLPGYSSPNPHNTNKPDLSRVVNDTQTIDTQTIDTKYVYDTTYGNLLETWQYKTYGTTDSHPSGTPLIYSTGYDSLKTYVLSTDPPLLPATTFTYDYGLGLPITVKDPNDNITTTTYDGLGRVTSIKYQNYAQANVKYTYPTPTGTPLSVSAPFAIKMEIWDEAAGPAAYRSAWQMMDGLGRVIQTQSPYETAGTLGLTDTAYDARGLTQYQGLPRVLSGTGGTYFTPTWASVPHTTTSYDALRRTTSAVYADGSSETYSYSGLRTTAIDRNSHKKVQEYDAFGRLIKVEEYMGSSNPYTLYATTQYTYDERDLLKSVTDADGNQSLMTYDGFGRKSEMTDPDMGNWHYRYNPLGTLAAQIDAKRQTINMYYDDVSRLIGKTYTTGPVNTDTYQPPVDPDYDDYTVKYYYDEGANGYGHRTRMVDPSGSTTWTYNALGQATNATQNIDFTDYTTSGTYDAFGRPLTQTLPSTEQLNYTYNAMGALASLSGTNTYISQIHYAATGQVTYQTLGNGLIQQYCYDTNTRRIKDIRVYPSSMQTCGTAPISPRLNLSFSYQPNGNISQIADATRNELIGYTYDELDRLLSGGGSDNRAYTYSATGNITSQNDTLPNPGTNGLAAWWSMDETSGTRNDSYSVNHLTDTNTIGAVSGKRGNAADFEKDNLEYLSKTSSAQLQMSTSDIYVGAWIKAEDTMVSNPNVISKLGTNREFNLRVLPSGVVQFIVYDTTGNNYTIASSNASITYGQWVYVEGWTDKANRTVYVNVNNGVPGSATWASNENRNGAGSAPLLIGAREYLGAIGEYWDGLIDEAVYYKRTLTPAERTWLYGYGIGRAYADLSLPSSSPNTYHYDDSAHKHAVTSLSTSETYTYDANGNMICRVENNITYKQDYNIENQLSAVYKMNGTCVSGTVLETTQFIYDGDGNLVKKVKPDGSKTIYVGGIYEVDKDSGGMVTRTVTYYPVAGAMRINIAGGSNTLYYILKDHLGSASVVTDANGVTVGEQRYYPYGATRFTSGTIYTDKLFTGQREMAGLGIYHYGARFYSPYINRFLQPDTIVPDPYNPQDLNRFSYVRNNPIRYNDPTGHFCSDPEDLWSPGCDGSGTPPPVTTPPPPPAPVVIINPDPLDDGQEQDDPTPTPNPAPDVTPPPVTTNPYDNIRRIVEFGAGIVLVSGGLLVTALGGLIVAVGLIEIVGLSSIAPPLVIPTTLHAGPAIVIGGFMALAGVGITAVGGYLIYDSLTP